jgi:hypothetical protein
MLPHVGWVERSETQHKILYIVYQQ